MPPVCGRRATRSSAIGRHGTAALAAWPTGEEGGRFGRLRVPHFLQMYASLPDALDAAVDRPPYLRDELRLAPTRPPQQ
jgi:hypothetical protein